MAEIDSAEGVELDAFLESDPLMRIALEEIARKQHLKETLEAQILANQFAQHCREVSATEGMGEVRRVMPAFAWHDIALQQGTYDCFQDKSFNKYLDRVAPETRLKCVAPKSGNGLALQVGWMPPEKRFHKRYEVESRGVERETVQD